MTIRRISEFSDALCARCGSPAAEGAAIDGKLLCQPHAQFETFYRFEVAAFGLLRYMGRDAFREAVEGVEQYDGNPLFFGHVRA